MSSAIRLFQGRFGRVALLDMDAPLVIHAHHHCHLLIKAAGPDTFFQVRDERCPLTDHSAVLVNAWEPHAYVHRAQQPENTVILALYVEPSWLTEIQRTLVMSAHPQFFPRPCVALTPSLRAIADKVVLELWWADQLAADKLESMLFELVMSVISPNSELKNYAALLRVRPNALTDARIRRAMNWMKDHLDHTIDLGAVARHCNLSRAHFFALFKQCVGMSPNVYFNVLRMESAFQQLAYNRGSLAELSDNLGFSAPPHFARFFRQHQGVAPSDYRRQVEVVDLPAAGSMPLAGETILPSHWM